MKKKLLSLLTLGMFAFTMSAYTNSYGIPDNIQDGNILHCFNWPASVVKANIQNIAEAGYGAVQLSPLQRPDIAANGTSWHDLYRPYDLAFKASGFCSEQDLRDLCTEAHKYGIKVIVDVVANHVDKTSGYHDPWWDSNGRVRWEGGINYGNRYTITHGQLGDYGDVNSESAEVQARAKAYVQALKNMGVDGIRWDAAKHIGLPSEGCNFWKEVTSVAGMWHYGEILDNPGPDASIIEEYAQYMSFTDNNYSNNAARNNGGLPTGYGGDWAVKYNLGNKCIYWGESHDTYSNDEWSQNVDQSVIDRAYAAYACRNDAAALYLARPNAKGFNSIKTGKGTDAYKGNAVAQVNRFRNKMVGRPDYFSSSGNAISVTRKDGGAVIVMKGSGNVTVQNGGSYCPAGTYKDAVSGGTFTVTASTITGSVGSTGIAVISKEDLGEYTPGTGSDNGNSGNQGGLASGSLYILGNIEGHQWDTANSPAMTPNGSNFEICVTLTPGQGETKCYFSFASALGDNWEGANGLNAKADRYGSATENAPASLGSNPLTKYALGVNASACNSYEIDPGTYTFSVNLNNLTVTITKGDTTGGDNGNNQGGNSGNNGNQGFTPTGDLYIIGNSSVLGEWSPNQGLKMSVEGSYYVARNIPLEPTQNSNDSYFSFTNYLSQMPGDEGWSDLNNGSHTRYGSTDDELDAQVSLGDYKLGSKNGDIKALYTTSGNYDIVVNPISWTLTLYKGGTAPSFSSGDNNQGGGDNNQGNQGTVTPPEGNLYILGDLVETGGWFPDKGVLMDKEGSYFVKRNFTVQEAFNNTLGYFSFADYISNKDADNGGWDDLNSHTRYGAMVNGKNAPIYLNTETPLYAATGDVPAFEVSPGTYDVIVNPNSWTVTLYAGGTAPDVSNQGGGDNNQGGGDNNQGGGDNNQGGGDNNQGGGDNNQGGGDNNQGGGDNNQGDGDNNQGGGDNNQGGGDNNQGGGDNNQGGGDNNQGGNNAVDSIETNEVVVISTGAGYINIEGAYGAQVAVLSINGQMIYNAPGANYLNINVAPGLYIVNVNGQAMKVLVR